MLSINLESQSSLSHNLITTLARLGILDSQLGKTMRPPYVEELMDKQDSHTL